MKKIFNFVLVLGILFLAFQLGITFFKKSHKIDYQLKVNDQNIKIQEEYIKNKDDEYYLFKVEFNNNSYVFDAENKFNKQKQVITNFKIYDEGKVTCISPVYIKNNDKSNVICNLNNAQTSLTEIRNNYNIDEFLKNLNGFDFERYNAIDEISVIGKNDVYKGNMYDNEYLIVYDYKDLISITKKNSERINFSNRDIYHNELGVLIDKYYVIPEFTSRPEYSNLLVINILNKKIDKVKLENPISTNLYINGIIDNKLYFFDKSNLVQYEVTPVKRTYRIVGNKSTGAQYYNGDWSNRNIYDFLTQQITFKENYPVKDKYVEAFETNRYYYYYNDNNEFYKVYKKDLDNPIFLFKYDDIKEVRVVNDCIYFMNDNIIYRYDENGIKKVLANNEFKYNFENIYGVYFK